MVFSEFDDIDFQQVLIGSLLGDGSLQRKGFSNPIYSEEHSLSQESYALWKNQFFNFKISYPTRTDLKRKANKTYQQICLFSRATPRLLNYYYRHYPSPERKKVVTREILTKLNPLGIAVWYCDDGSFDYDSNRIILSTDGFSQQENLLIQDFFKTKYDIEFKFSGKRIYCDVRNSTKFLHLIRNSIPQCMKYKIGLDEVRREKSEKRKKEWSKEYNSRLKTKKHKQEYNRKYRIKNREKLLENYRQYYYKNRERLLQQKKESWLSK